MERPDNIRAVALSLASTEDIRARSFGAVTRPATFDRDTAAPVPGGLFCVEVFSEPSVTSCVCGKLTGPETEGRKCGTCGFPSGPAVAHRRRPGHIDLAAPVVHPWLLYLPPYPIALLLGLGRDDVVAVTHCRKSLAFADESGLPQIVDQVGEADQHTGPAALREALRRVDLDSLLAAGCLDRGWLARSLRSSGTRPEALVLDAIPVLPAGLRPRAHLADGIAVTVQANDLYLALLERNERLAKALEAGVPEPMKLDLQRALQEAVERLLDGQESQERSLATVLRGKEGIFRQNMLGKRQDYSGRSVITPAPDLRLHEVGLPEEMAFELFRPFVMGQLLKGRKATTLIGARRMVECRAPAARQALLSVIQDHPVLMNRAPTLHRLGIQAFYPRLVEGQAIALHPLVCKAFNADFDGDQMAVHVPLTEQAVAEARDLLSAPRNIFSPGTGEPLAGPTQEMVLGCAYLTRSAQSDVDPVSLASIHDARAAGLAERLSLTTPVAIPWQGERIETTPGRAIFNDALPESLRFVNEPMDRPSLESLVTRCRDEEGPEAAAALVNRLHDLGFRYASLWGISVSWADYPALADRGPAIERALESAAAAAEGEARLSVWTHLVRDLTERVWQHLAEDQAGQNPLHSIVATGARANLRMVREAAGMVGPVASVGTLPDEPEVIVHSFLDGLRPPEFLARSRTARLGLSTLMLRLADHGYLGRRLVAAAGDITTVEDDCGTRQGLRVGVQPAALVGRRLAEPVDTESGQAAAGTVVDRELAAAIAEAGAEEVCVRSPLTCRSVRGVCVACYGCSPETGQPVGLGSAVGVNAAMSLTEAATQLLYGIYHTAMAKKPPELPPSGLRRLIALIEAGGVGTGPQRDRWMSMEEALNECGEQGIGAAICADMAGVYSDQGCWLDRRHFEVITRALMSRVRVAEPGDSHLIPGEIISHDEAVAVAHHLANEGKAPPTFETIMSRATDVATPEESFLASASFGRTSEVLLRAALAGARDELRGIRESLIVGKLIPVGTGFRQPAG